MSYLPAPTLLHFSVGVVETPVWPFVGETTVGAEAGQAANEAVVYAAIARQTSAREIFARSVIRTPFFSTPSS